jgi:hypothetical protein
VTSAERQFPPGQGSWAVAAEGTLNATTSSAAMVAGDATRLRLITAQ